MYAFREMPAFVTKYIRKLRGGSQPILAVASDGLQYVIKFTNNLQGPNLLFNESMGSELYRACGLAVPKWKPMMVTDAFLDQNPDCWMQTAEGTLRPDSGFCFASRYLEEEGSRMLEILPKTSFNRLKNPDSFWMAWLIDICACHTDNRQAIFLEDTTGHLDAFFVDHGHLFGGPHGGEIPHLLASRYLDPRIYQSVSLPQLLGFQRVAGNLDVSALWRCLESLPPSWKTASAVDGLMQGLSRLSNPGFLREAFDAMVDVQQNVVGGQHIKGQIRPKPPVSVLRVGVQTAGHADWLYAADANCAVCA